MGAQAPARRPWTPQRREQHHHQRSIGVHLARRAEHELLDVALKAKNSSMSSVLRTSSARLSSPRSLAI
jgi:hypothetical protein